MPTTGKKPQKAETRLETFPTEVLETQTPTGLLGPQECKEVTPNKTLGGHQRPPEALNRPYGVAGAT